MIPEIDELKLRRAFNRFCKKALQNEAINALVALQRRKKIILNFSDINFNEELIAGNDDFFFDPEEVYSVRGRSVCKSQLITIINRLDEPYRRIIKFYYFYDINDRLISELLQVPRSTIQRWRSRALSWLRKDLEESLDVCSSVT